jgi:hypothetical protein
MTVRELLYQTLSSDSELSGLGFAAENVYANGGMDSPPESGDVWVTLNWGEETPALVGQRGRVRTTRRPLTLWFYSRQRDYGIINAAIKRTMDVMESLVQTPTGDGVVTCTEWQADGPDGYDDIYSAIFRTSAYMIIANGD